MAEITADIIRHAKRSQSAARSGAGHPRNLQVAALCWRRDSEGSVRVLLITSRESRRWVIPKGWPMRKRTNAEAAAREAYEEAGVQGEPGTESIGFFNYQKQLAPGKLIPCVVQVFPLEVHSLLRKYPENGQRKSRWFSRKKAASKVREPELKALIRSFAPGTPNFDPSSF